MGKKNALKNLAELNAAHKKFMKASTDDIAKSLDKVGFKFFQELQVHTPRDTSRAVNGWIPVVDKPPSEWMPNEGLSSYRPLIYSVKGHVKFYSVIWITNNVPYIKYLDNGHSSQAPNGFTVPSLRKTTIYIASETEKLNRKKYHV